MTTVNPELMAELFARGPRRDRKVMSWGLSTSPRPQSGPGARRAGSRPRLPHGWLLRRHPSSAPCLGSPGWATPLPSSREGPLTRDGRRLPPRPELTWSLRRAGCRAGAPSCRLCTERALAAAPSQVLRSRGWGSLGSPGLSFLCPTPSSPLSFPRAM